MFRHGSVSRRWPAALLVLLAAPAGAQSFRVQCPTSTITHPTAANNNAEPAYSGPTRLTCSVPGGCTPTNNVGFLQPDLTATTTNVNGAIKCQQISGGDGYSTMGDGTQTYMFSFGPLSGVVDIANGAPGTEFPSVFNAPYPASSAANALPPGYPASNPSSGPVSYNGAIGLAQNIAYTFTIYDISEVGHTVTVVLNTPSPFKVGDQVVIGQGIGTDLGAYAGTWTVTAINIANPFFPAGYAFQYTDPATGLADVTESPDATASSAPGVDGHVDPRQIMDVGVMNGNIPAPLMAIDEDDEFFLTLTNVGMVMRPDLFEQHTVHFHGYPNASAFYDGVPDASVAINIGASFTYYYLAPEAGTYFWHCHITPPEHLQMGMVGQVYVRPRQNRVPAGTSLYASLQQQQLDPRTACNSSTDILCSNPLPATNTGATQVAGAKYAYNDGDGSTRYDVEYPLQIHGFDPNFHFVGMTFNPEGFADMKDKYFLLNGRSYPDTVTPDPLTTQSTDGVLHVSQPLNSIVNIPAGGRALLRISSLDVSEYQTLASLGIPMQVIALNAKLLRDQAGNNLYYTTNSITLGGGESLDVILDASDTTKYPSGSVFYLYTPNLDHLSNDAENFGGLMTEVRIN
ncbi:MAG TPA: multicopper oxidase domain-containing protein [Anaeromyxobacter sp.]|nr:multicopper oxidase domain-containing protein [Anaeromyxobacter sp.]